MKREEFSDICPYDDSEFQEKIAGLVKEPGFEHAVKYVMPDADYQEFAKGLMTINSQEAFQINVMLPFLQMLVKKTTSAMRGWIRWQNWVVPAGLRSALPP